MHVAKRSQSKKAATERDILKKAELWKQDSDQGLPGVWVWSWPYWAIHNNGLRGKSRGTCACLPQPALEEVCIMALQARWLWAVDLFIHSFIYIYPAAPPLCQVPYLGLKA